MSTVQGSPRWTAPSWRAWSLRLAFACPIPASLCLNSTIPPYNSDEAMGACTGLYWAALGCFTWSKHLKGKEGKVRMSQPGRVANQSRYHPLSRPPFLDYRCRCQGCQIDLVYLASVLFPTATHHCQIGGLKWVGQMAVV